MIGFRPLAKADLPLVREWLLRPHVRRWWDDGSNEPYPDGELADYHDAIVGKDPTYRYLILREGVPIGLIQHYLVGDDGEYAKALALGEDAVGIDIFIAESALIGRGVGPEALRGFILDVALPFHGIDVSVIGPSVSNAAAIRAYEKVGYRWIKDAVVPGEHDVEHLMRVTRADLEAPAVR